MRRFPCISAVTSTVASTVASAIVTAALAFLLGSAIAAGATAPDDFVVMFWAGPGAGRDPRVIRIDDNPYCTGQIATARVSTMPPVTEDGSLQPELAVEYDASGRVLARWPLPVNGIVVGIAGDEIIVPHGDVVAGKPALLIATSGRIRRGTVPSSGEKDTVVACPSNLGMPKQSAYLRCHVFRDGKTKRMRYVAYEGPCT